MILPRSWTVNRNGVAQFWKIMYVLLLEASFLVAKNRVLRPLCNTKVYTYHYLHKLAKINTESLWNLTWCNDPLKRFSKVYRISLYFIFFFFSLTHSLDSTESEIDSIFYKACPYFGKQLSTLQLAASSTKQRVSFVVAPYADGIFSVSLFSEVEEP